jgi:hypothetical protein
VGSIAFTAQSDSAGQPAGNRWAAGLAVGIQLQIDFIQRAPEALLGDITKLVTRQSSDTVDNQWDQLHSPLNLILQASLLETGGRPVTRRAARLFSGTVGSS